VEGDRVYILAMYEVFCLDLDGLSDGNDGIRDELSIMTRPPFDLPEGTQRPTELPPWAADVIWHTSLKPLNLKVQDATCCSVIEVDGQIWVSTAHELGSRVRSDRPGAGTPHLVVLDKETGRLIARDGMDVPIVFHGEWSSPSLIEVNGEKAVLFGDGYGVLHALGIPKPGNDGRPVILEEYWTFDMNPHEWRFLPDGREIVYTLDKRLEYKYPPDYYTNPERYFMYGVDPAEEANSSTRFSYLSKGLADGRHETITGPCEIIAMPAVCGHRIYLGIGRDNAYGLTKGKGRFVCLEVDNVRRPPRLLWEDREIGRTQCTASIAEGRVYIADGAGMLNCYEADTGEVVYRYELDARRGIKERSQMVTDGKVYIGTHNGTMKVLDAGRIPKLLAESKLPGPPATVEAANGLILVATPRRLLLYGRGGR
jgi:outer membrane protein assembly factor BamB